MYAVSNISSIARAEFQLIEDKHGFIIGRVFIPTGVKGSVKGTLVRKMQWSKSTVIEFIPRDLAEVERCIKEYAASNIAFNRVRTINLLKQLRKGRPIQPVQQEETIALVEPLVMEVSHTVTEPEQSSEVTAIVPYIPPYGGDIKEINEISMAELEDGYEYMNLKELKAVATERGIKGVSKMKKAQLITRLSTSVAS